MVNRNAPTSYFWNCLGSSLFVTAIGVAISVARTEALSLEVARYKLKTGTAITEIIQVANELEQTANTLPIAPRQKQKIIQQLDRGQATIERANSEIERDSL